MDLLLLPISAMGKVLIVIPIVALFPAVVFFWLFTKKGYQMLLIAALAWFFYIPYEYLMKFQILCSGECNIRVDLLLIYPILLLVSLIAVIRYFWIQFRS